MVRIIDYNKRQNSEGKDFYTLTLMGDVEFVKSSITGNYYATAFKGTITTTFNEETCKSLIGRVVPGQIEKVIVEPYEYKLQNGETIMLTHTYRFNPAQKQQSVEEVIFAPEPVTAAP